MPALSIATSFGACTLLWDGEAVLGFALPASGPDTGPGNLPEAAPPAWVAALAGRVRRHLDGELQDFVDVPYDFAGVSSFQRQVYQAALEVKAGHTQTYGELAAVLGLGPAGSRAVGTALGRNPWPLLVPCHRFVGAGDRLTGFSAPGGVETKARLLALEGARWF